MKKNTLLLVLMLMAGMITFAQTVNLTFTGRDANNQYVPLNSVRITNYTHSWQETIYWPDTVLTMQYETGIGDVETCHGASLQLSQNNPNPFEGTTYAYLTMAESGDVAVEITDVTGRVVGTQNLSTQSGIHQLRITLSTAGMYFLTARQNGHITSIKMVNQGNGGKDAIEFIGSVETNGLAFLQASKSQNGPKYTTTHTFQLGDQMEYIGFATINGHEVASAHVNQAQNASETFVLTFDEAQNNTDAHPCPGTPTVTDVDGNVYNTVMIGTQCWMKENMRATHFSNGDSITLGLTATNYSEPYYYDYFFSDIPLEKRGYLYNWPAAVHGMDTSSSVPSGIQGICPTGWHVPSWGEWDALRVYLGSKSEFHCGGCVECIAPALCDSVYWNASSGSCTPGNLTGNNATGFSAVPAGYYWGVDSDPYQCYSSSGNRSDFWSTTLSSGSDVQSGPRNTLFIQYYLSNAAMGGVFENHGLSVRCIKD